MHEPDVAVKRVLCEVDGANTGRPSLEAFCLGQKRNADSFSYKLNNGFQFVEFTNLSHLQV